MKKHYALFLTMAVAFLFTACGADDGITCDSTASTGMAGDAAQVACTGTYKIVYTPSGKAAMGKSQFNLNIKTISDGSGYSGATPTIKPWMVMSSMAHGAVVDIVTDNGNGSYDVTVYYLMASSMNGNRMGDWELQITVGDETAKVYPEVMMAMDGTARATLKNDSDMIAGMSGAAETRTYYLFKDSLSGSNGSHMFSLKIATRESMMKHPAVSVGTELTNEKGAKWTVSNMTVRGSTDKSTWVTFTDKGNGHWSGMGIAGLMDGMEGKIYIEMTINGVSYTASGSPAIFTVTPGGGGMDM